jgi:hypothetical protein
MSLKAIEAVKINSTVRPSEIGVYDYTPTSTLEWKYRYSCPVCLRYFSHMLISNCCRNYLCYFCAIDLSANSANFDARCPHCNNAPVLLYDVEAEAKVKLYSDSPTTKFRPKTDDVGQARDLEIVLETRHGDLAGSVEGRGG